MLKIPSADKAKSVAIILGIIVVGVVVYTVYYRLKKLKDLPEKLVNDAKDLTKKVTGLKDDVNTIIQNWLKAPASNPFSSQFKAAGYFSEAEKLAKEIKDSLGFFFPNPMKVEKIFLSLKTASQVALIAKAFYKLYGKTLYNFLNETLNHQSAIENALSTGAVAPLILAKHVAEKKIFHNIILHVSKLK
jgi:hypothetical protein